MCLNKFGSNNPAGAHCFQEHAQYDKQFTLGYPEVLKAVATVDPHFEAFVWLPGCASQDEKRNQTLLSSTSATWCTGKPMKNHGQVLLVRYQPRPRSSNKTWTTNPSLRHANSSSWPSYLPGCHVRNFICRYFWRLLHKHRLIAFSWHRESGTDWLRKPGCRHVRPPSQFNTGGEVK